ncbi:SDR family oxidoreductase [Pseudomonas gingeri]|uniref:SDR family NAD(P)-dependent oxidoreductase n=1 Tax=Pseudomonas gingeri TaxID=117681 RepID=UPI0015A0B51F|nr:SDR family oxidoreductase [Pseudomonas gingeri]NWD73145.1 SDR family oxidoreductase [Pseudomonas gingeri]
MDKSTRFSAWITGASSGIGKAYARHLAGQGYDLVLVARRLDQLEALACEIRTRQDVHVRVLQADLSTEEGCVRIEEGLTTDQAFSLFVNNAGIGALGPFLDTDLAASMQLLNLNIAALTRLSYAALNQFRVKGQGTLINIGSIGALRAIKNGAVYGASKAYVLSFSRALQLEIEGTQIRIQVVMPGPVRTEFFSAAGADDSVFPAQSYIAPQDLVAAAMAGLANGERVTFPTLADVGQWEELVHRQDALRDLAGRLGIPALRYAIPSGVSSSVTEAPDLSTGDVKK